MANPFEILGWEFRKKDDEKQIKAGYVNKTNDDSAFVINAGHYGFNAYTLNFDFNGTTENDLIRKYRDLALQPEVDSAVTDIVNEAVNGDNESICVEIVLDDLKQPEKIKKRITEEFDVILQKLNFFSESYEIFRKWYVDGKINYYVVIDEANPRNGIDELRYISPLHLRKIRQEEKVTGPHGVEVTKSFKEYYSYTKILGGPYLNPNNISNAAKVSIPLSADSVVQVTSGLLNEETNIAYSYLHKAIVPSNQLRMLENAILIYRMSRAPERRIFYVDVGNMPTQKANEYLRSIMARFKNKMVFDTSTGELKDSKNTLSMMEDYWFPRRADGKSTQVETLPGAQNLGDIADIEMFKKKLFMSLNVPYGRIAQDQSTPFSVGKSAEISRDEIKFSKFISRLRKRFSILFYELLKRQLLLKQIITKDEWEEFKNDITFNFTADVFFQELKEMEILRERITMAEQAMPMLGLFLSKEFIRRKVLQQTDEEIEEMKKQMDEERDDDAENQIVANAMMQAGGVGDPNMEEPFPAPAPGPQAKGEAPEAQQGNWKQVK